MATSGKNLSDFDRNQVPKADHMRFGIVVSEWNSEITEGLYQGAHDALVDLGASEENILRFDVPGSFELIHGAAQLMEQGNVEAIICLGSVIRGETAHFDYVCQGVAHGIKDLNVRATIPVIFGVLTDDNWEQAKARSGGIHGNKGTEAAVSAVKMIALNRKLKND
jgi:6,7-dimethyl-8-ribityllumazine synthase